MSAGLEASNVEVAVFADFGCAGGGNLAGRLFVKREFRRYSRNREEDVVGVVRGVQLGEQLRSAVNQTRRAQWQIERPDEIRVRWNIRRFARQLNRFLGQADAEGNAFALRHRQIVHVVVDEEKATVAIRAYRAAQCAGIRGAGRRLLRQECNHRRELRAELVVKLVQQLQFAEGRMHL